MEILEEQTPQGQSAEEANLNPDEPQLTAEDTSQEPEKPVRLYAGKFKSPEDLERSYLEAERKMHEATQETAAERQRRMELENRAKQDTAQEQQEKLRQLREENPAAYAEYLFQIGTQQFQESQRIQSIVEKWRVKNPDLGDEESEGLVARYVSQTDPSEPYGKRLEKATQMARDYLDKKLEERETQRGEKEKRLKDVITEPAASQRVTQEEDKEPTRGDYFSERREIHNRAFRR